MILKHTSVVLLTRKRENKKGVAFLFPAASPGVLGAAARAGARDGPAGPGAASQPPFLRETGMRCPPWPRHCCRPHPQLTRIPILASSHPTLPLTFPPRGRPGGRCGVCPGARLLPPHGRHREPGGRWKYHGAPEALMGLERGAGSSAAAMARR